MRRSLRKTQATLAPHYPCQLFVTALRKTRLVFASTIAVCSQPMPDPVTDETPLAPDMLYGAQKLMMEVALSNFFREGMAGRRKPQALRRRGARRHGRRAEVRLHVGALLERKARQGYHAARCPPQSHMDEFSRDGRPQLYSCGETAGD